MITTQTTATALPFLLPAVNLAIGDRVRITGLTTHTGAVESITRGVLDSVTIGLVGDHRTFTCDATRLIEVTHRRPIAALNDTVTALDDMATEWDLIAASYRRVGDGREDVLAQAQERAQCADAVRAILARLQ